MARGYVIIEGHSILWLLHAVFSHFFCFVLHVALLVLVSCFLLHIFGVDDTNNVLDMCTDILCKTQILLGCNVSLIEKCFHYATKNLIILLIAGSSGY